MKLLIEPIWPWPQTALTMIAMFVIVITTYPKRLQHLTPTKRRAMFSLRILAATLLALAMLRPTIQQTAVEKATATMLVVADSSRSMTIQDGPNGVSRREALRQAWDRCRAELDTLEQDVSFRLFDFGEELTAVDEFTPQADARQTAIGHALERLLEDTRGDRILAALLFGDGAQRAYSPRDIDPRAVAERFGNARLPIYTTGFGGAGLAGGTLDLSVDEILVAPTAFEKKTVPVEARIRVSGPANTRFTVRLLVEDRSGKRPGEAGEMKIPAATRGTKSVVELVTTQDDELVRVPLGYIPARSGEVKIAVEAMPLDGELKQNNNQRATIITVRSGGLRVAYFDRLRDDVRFISLVNESENIQLDYIPIHGREFQHLNKVDESLFEPDKYDVYMIGDVPAAALGIDNLKLMAERIAAGAGLMMTGGYFNYSAGGYGRSPLAQYLPVELDAAGPSTDIDPSKHIAEPIQLVPTRAGLSHFVLKLDLLGDAQQNEARWAKLPPLLRANRLRPKQAGLVQSLANGLVVSSGESVPLLLAHQVGGARVMAFAADTTWRWGRPKEGDFAALSRFWRQTILWLAHQENNQDQAVWVDIDRRNLSPRDPVNVTFGARDAQKQPLADAKFQVRIIDPDGESMDLAARKADGENQANTESTEKPGDYWVRVEANLNDEPLGEAWTRFIVDARDLELDNPATDLSLLRDIAELSGGQSLTPEQLLDQIKTWSQKGFPSLEVERVETTTTWDNWWFLMAFVLVMTAEWTLRKRSGLV